MKCSLKMLLKYFQIRRLFVGRESVWQDTRTRANTFPAPTVASLARDWLPIFQSVQTQQFVLQPKPGIFVFVWSDIFSERHRGEVVGVFCEIVKGIIIFCLSVFTPHFLQPAESHTIDIFWTEKLRKTDIPRTSPSLVSLAWTSPWWLAQYCSQVKYIIVI